MLESVDESLEAFLRATVPLGASEVDVSFEAPERQWSAKLNRPTVNLFLWDIRRSAERSRGGLEELHEEGRVVRRLALPRIELRYLVTAWTADHGDERALLSGLMRTVLAHGQIPGDFLAEALVALPPLSLLMARTGEQHVDVFSALEGQLKPAINVMVVAAVDTQVVTLAGPPTYAIDLRLRDLTGDRRGGPVGGGARSSRRRVAGEVLDPSAVGAVVRSPHGKALVNVAGRFLVAAEPGDELVLETVPPRTVTVPAAGGVVVD